MVHPWKVIGWLAALFYFDFGFMTSSLGSKFKSWGGNDYERVWRYLLAKVGSGKSIRNSSKYQSGCKAMWWRLWLWEIIYVIQMALLNYHKCFPYHRLSREITQKKFLVYHLLKPKKKNWLSGGPVSHPMQNTWRRAPSNFFLVEETLVNYMVHFN